MLARPAPLMSIGAIARRLGVGIHQVQYVVTTRKIGETMHHRELRVFDGEGMSRIREALAR